MLVLAVVVLVILLLIVCLLVIPFYISFQLEGNIESQRTRFAMEWLWGAVGLGITSYEGRRWTSFLLGHRSVYSRERKPKPKEKRKIDLSKLPTSSEIGEIYKHGTRLFKALLKSVSLTNLRCRLRFGLGDPAATGIAIGAYHAFMGAVSPWMGRWEVSVEPIFHKEVLEGEIGLGIRLRLVRLVIPFIQLMRRRSIRRMMRSS